MYSRREYTFDKFIKSRRPDKKYTAVLVHRITGRKVHVHFGGIRPDGTPYEQYFDNALGLYRAWDHNDKTRRRRWLLRHARDGFEPYSPSYFSKKYLW